MKKILFLLTIALAGSLWAAGDVTVQVISAVYEKSVTKELDAKIKKTGLAVHKKVENGRYVVTLGTFKNEHEAQKALKAARHLVSSDAFVRLVQRPDAVHTAKSTHPAKESTVTAHKTPQAPATAVVVTNEKKPTVAATTTTAPAASTAAATPIVSTQSDCDKREMHKNEFSEAINYYKNSPYHRFEPVTLRQ
jgi:hypothetical protein